MSKKRNAFVQSFYGWERLVAVFIAVNRGHGRVWIGQRFSKTADAVEIDMDAGHHDEMFVRQSITVCKSDCIVGRSKALYTVLVVPDFRVHQAGERSS